MLFDGGGRDVVDVAGQADGIGSCDAIAELHAGGRDRQHRRHDAESIHHSHVFFRRPHRHTWEAVGLVDAGCRQRVPIAGWKEVGVDIDQRHAPILGVVAYDGWVQPLVRQASSSDDLVMDAIAREGDASADADYLALVRSQHGRLLVAERDDRVVAFGGVVDIDGVAMLTDLFVAADARGAGIGTMLLDALFDGSSRRMTFSSKHPAALAAYQRVGMEPQWRLLYLKGVANGGGTGLPVAGVATRSGEPRGADGRSRRPRHRRCGGHSG